MESQLKVARKKPPSVADAVVAAAVAVAAIAVVVVLLFGSINQR